MSEIGDAVLRDILVVLNSDRTLGEILDYLVTRARELFDSQACVLYRFNPEQGSISIDASAGLPPVMVEGKTPPIELPLFAPGSLGSPLLDDMVLSEALAVYSDSQLEAISQAVDQVPVSVDLAAPVRTWFGHIGRHYRAAMSVPLEVKEEIYGTLGFYYTAPHEFTDEARRLAVGFASQAALAIENAHLRLQAEQVAARAAVLQERGRLARDLHDSVTQSLYSLTLLSEAARRLAGSGDLDKVQEAIGRLGEIGQQALKEMRLLVYQLRPSVLRREGLVRALAYRLETVERRAGIEATLVVEGPVDLSPSSEEQVYHIVQEALNNALKHAAATGVTVRIASQERLTVEVADNGVGFDLERLSEEHGIGLTSMRERVESLGGELTLISSPGQGTRVVISLRDDAGATSGSHE
ncbi:MAG: GAF domain-containing sensor histidine kinase [Anaerolineae bacterium]